MADHALALLVGQAPAEWTRARLQARGVHAAAATAAAHCRPSWRIAGPTSWRPRRSCTQPPPRSASPAANLYPQISLTATASLQADGAARHCSTPAAAAAGMTGSLTQPLFNHGALRAQQRAAVDAMQASLAGLRAGGAGRLRTGGRCARGPGSRPGAARQRAERGRDFEREPDAHARELQCRQYRRAAGARGRSARISRRASAWCARRRSVSKTVCSCCSRSVDGFRSRASRWPPRRPRASTALVKIERACRPKAKMSLRPPVVVGQSAGELHEQARVGGCRLCGRVRDGSRCSGRQ